MRIFRDADGVHVEAPAKVNLYLEVLGKRPDGYHELITIMQATDFCDEVIVAEAASGVSLAVEGAELPTGEGNLVVRAAKAFLDAHAPGRGARMRLVKRIPMGAGLGGGSSDAAATVVAIDRLYGLGISRTKMAAVGGKLGSDVNFFFNGGTALCRGRGEQVAGVYFPYRAAFHYVLLTPGTHVSTAEVYQNVGGIPLIKWMEHPHQPRERFEAHLEQTGEALLGHTQMIMALTMGDVAIVGARLKNRLEPVTLALYPELEPYKEALQAEGLAALMSGSGSSFFGLAPTREKAVEAASRLETRFPGKVRVLSGGGEPDYVWM